MCIANLSAAQGPVQIYTLGPDTRANVTTQLHESGYRKDPTDRTWKKFEDKILFRASIRPLLPLQASGTPEVRLGYLLQHALSIQDVYPRVSDTPLHRFSESVVEANLSGLLLIALEGIEDAFFESGRIENESVPKLVAGRSGVAEAFLDRLERTVGISASPSFKSFGHRALVDALIRRELRYDNYEQLLKLPLPELTLLGV